MTLDDDDFELPSTEDIEYYQSFRKAGLELNNELVKELPQSAYKECGKKLGIWQGNKLVVGREEELDVFFDYCVHQFRINKVNVIERRLALKPPSSDSIEFSVLQSFSQSYYSVFAIKEIFENKGILVVDLLYQNEIFVIDIGLSKSTSVGMVCAGHILPFRSFHITSGAWIPVPTSLLENEKLLLILEKFIDEDSDNLLSKSKEALFSSQVIRTVLKAHAQDESIGWGYLN